MKIFLMARIKEKGEGGNGRRAKKNILDFFFVVVADGRDWGIEI